VWNGKVVRLKKLKADLKMEIDRFAYLSSNILHFVLENPDECLWKKVPRMLVELDQQEKLFAAAGARIDFDGVNRQLIRGDDFFAQRGDPKCGSPRQFLQRFGK